MAWALQDTQRRLAWLERRLSSRLGCLQAHIDELARRPWRPADRRSEKAHAPPPALPHRLRELALGAPVVGPPRPEQQQHVQAVQMRVMQLKKDSDAKKKKAKA